MIKLKTKVNFILPVLLIFLTAIQMPFLLADRIPGHDSLDFFQIYHYMYSDYYFNNEIPQWCPYIFYGVPLSMYTASFLSPVTVLCSVIGKLCSVTNALLLFKLSVFIEHLVFLYGIYRLARFFNFKAVTILFVGFSALSISLWQTQIHHNFRLFYLLPLILSAFFHFAAYQRFKYLLLAGFLLLVQFIGLPIKFSALNLIIIASIFTTYLVSYKGIWRRIFTDFKTHLYLNFFLIGCLLFFLFFILYFSYTSMHDIGFNTAGRSTLGKLSIIDFLAGRNNISLQTILSMLFFGYPLRVDQTIYWGLGTVFLFLLALFTVKDTGFRSLGVTVLVMAVLTLGGYSTLLGYYVIPGFDFIKHFNFIYGIIGLLVIFGAGFGFEFLCNSLKKKYLFFFLCFIIVILDIYSSNALEFFFRMSAVPPPHLMLQVFNERLLFWRGLGYISGISICLLVIVLCLSKGTAYARQRAAGATGIIILICSLLDLGLYRWSVSCSDIKTSPAAAADISRISAPAYKSKRPWHDQNAGRLEQIYISLNTKLYETVNAATESDKLLFDHGVYFFPKNLKALFYARGFPDLLDPQNADVHKKLYPAIVADKPFTDVLGRHEKIRFVPACLKADEKKCAELIEDIKDINRVAVIAARGNENVSPVPADRQTKTGIGNGAFKYEILKFTANEVKLEVENSSNGWLVYSDNYASGWHARVNDRPVKLEKAYLTFKSVYLQGGRNIVQFVYTSKFSIYIYAILIIDLIFLLMFLGFLTKNVFNLFSLKKS